VKYAIFLTADEAWNVLIKNNRDFMEIIHINMAPINGSSVLTDTQRFAVVDSVSVHKLYLLKLLSSIFVVDSPFSIPLSSGKRKRAYSVFS
jgi:hypothetical protein